MGLSFHAADVHWSYSGFHDLRERLAKQIGVTLDTMEGFGGSRSWDEINDPLVPFLNHSDCEGILTAAEMRQVSPRIRKILDLDGKLKGSKCVFCGLERQAVLKLCDYMDKELSEKGDHAVLVYS